MKAGVKRGLAEDSKELLAAHNKKFKPQTLYEPRLHSVKDTRLVRASPPCYCHSASAIHLPPPSALTGLSPCVCLSHDGAVGAEDGQGVRNPLGG